MSDEIHVDREKIMSAAKVDFHERYEVAISNLIDNIGGFSETLRNKLKAKRDFGFQKYGERSFQGSFENAMSTPSYDDLEEELIDAINYLLHIRFKLLFSDPTYSEFSYNTLKQLTVIYNELKQVQQKVEND